MSLAFNLQRAAHTHKHTHIEPNNIRVLYHQYMPYPSLPSGCQWKPHKQSLLGNSRSQQRMQCSLSLLCARRHAHKYACVCVLLSGLHFNSYIYMKCVFGLKNLMMSHSLAELNTLKLFECMSERNLQKLCKTS